MARISRWNVERLPKSAVQDGLGDFSNPPSCIRGPCAYIQTQISGSIGIALVYIRLDLSTSSHALMDLHGINFKRFCENEFESTHLTCLVLDEPVLSPTGLHERMIQRERQNFNA